MEKYLSGTITEEERDLFHQMLDRPEYYKQLQLIFDRELEEHAFEGAADENIASLIKQNIFKQIRAEKVPAKMIRFNWKRMAVAAVFIFLMGSGVWWLTRPGKPDTGLSSGSLTVSKNVLAPGGNKAILTLANGTKILLDTVAKGVFAQQGKVSIIKLQNGELAYTENNGKAAESLYNTITTPKGGQYQLLLSDGSKVWLNATSSLRFPASFSGNKRVVELNGEGYFEVAKNSSMPFHVKMNDLDIRVIGTHFNINGYSDEAFVRTTLLEGKVSVAKAGKTYLLSPGEQASVSDKGAIELNTLVNTDEVIAWKNGMFHFKSADLKSILRQASRWYDVNFQYEADITERFSGQISRNVNATELLEILQLTGKVHFKTNGRNIIVMP